jgi:hypothetical protein
MTLLVLQQLLLLYIILLLHVGALLGGEEAVVQPARILVVELRVGVVELRLNPSLIPPLLRARRPPFLLLLRPKRLLLRHLLRMKVSALRHHPLISLGDGNAPDDALMLAPILAQLDQGAALGTVPPQLTQHREFSSLRTRPNLQAAAS